MLTPPSLQPLVPQQHQMPNGNIVYYFSNPNLELVKLDFTFESGSAYQQLISQAHAANQLFGEATVSHDAQQVAEFMDFRGIVVERMTDITQGNISIYFLRKYAEELFPLVREFFDQPVITKQLFDSYVSRRRLKIAQGFQQTNFVARNRFYELLYGFDSPMGTFAVPSDLDALTIESVEEFTRRHYRLDTAHIVLAGQVDAGLLALADQFFSTKSEDPHCERFDLSDPVLLPPYERKHFVIPSAVQSTLRIGRVLPMKWDSEEYAQFLVLNTILGGYFGSRLMSNIREEKGYTYGIYSQTQVYRGAILFYITADVAAEATNAAVDEVMKELRRLQDEPVGLEELERVRNVLMGDFIRSIDGTFEISERYRQMTATAITEQFSTNYIKAVQTTSPEQIQSLARCYLSDLLVVTVGPELEVGSSAR